MKKLLAIGIILLFIGINIIPATSQELEKPPQLSFGGKWWYVGGSGPGNYSIIQDAVDNASDGDTVFVYDYSSPYRENILIDKNLKVVGENRNTTIIISDNHSEAVNITGAGVILSNFTFRVEDGNINHITLNSNNIQITLTLSHYK
jgi:hypothetical protein